MLVWDQHVCLPLRPDASVDGLREYANAGVGFVSVNAGYDAISWHDCLHLLANFRNKVSADPDLQLVETADDLVEAVRNGRLAVAFDLEGAEALDGDVNMVEVYHRLGVRTMLIAYNYPNRAGGGCHGDPQDGLTGFGRDVVREMNRVGMVVDATHCSYRTTMDLFEASQAPVVFSHSVPAGVASHERNITDEQMRACAATGGVIGINGVGLFLGDERADAKALMRAVDYAVDVVGPAHVGLGLDYVVDRAELEAWLEDGDLFPAAAGYGPEMAIAPPELIAELIELLLQAGYDERDVRGIAGENFLRVAREVWSPSHHSSLST